MISFFSCPENESLRRTILPDPRGNIPEAERVKTALLQHFLADREDPVGGCQGGGGHRLPAASSIYR